MARGTFRERPAVLPALGLLAGVALAAYAEFPLDLALAPAVCFWLGAMAAYRRSSRWATALLGASTLLSGLWLEDRARATHRASVESLFPGNSLVRELDFVGELLEAEPPDWEGALWLRVRGGPETDSTSRSSQQVIRIRVPPPASRRLDTLRRGDRIRVWCRLRRSPEPSVGLRANGLHARGSVKTDRLIEVLSRTGRVRAIDRIRRTTRQRLDAVFRGDEPARALVGAMLLGDRTGLDPGQRRALRDAGLLHLVAISGLHVGLLIVTMHWGLGRIRLSPWVRLPIVLVLLAGFIAGVGSRPSVVRAAIGCGVVLFGRCLGREGDGLNGLALLAALLVAYHPASLRDPGFQLTFLATAGILALAGPSARSLPIGGPWAGSLAVSLSAYVATAPAVAFHFRWLAPVGLLSNVVALPLCAGVLLGGYGSVMLFHVPWLGQLPAAVARLAAKGILAVGSTASAWDRGAFCVAAPPALLIGACYVLLATGATLTERGGPRPARAALRGLFGLCLVWLHVGAPPRIGQPSVEAVIIDVGQGLAVALRGADGSHLLVDAGGSARRGFDPGERIVVPFLVDRGAQRVAAMIVTHDHLDHIGGAFAVVRELELGELWVGPGIRDSPRTRALAALARQRGTAVVLAEAGTVSAVGGVSVRILAPPRNSTDQGNDRSVVVLAGTRPSRLLVPGDLETAGERALLDSGTSVRSEALVIAHHGSRHGSGEAFLRKVGPARALLSAGRGNPFGHPHPEVLERLRLLGIPWLRTDELGSITLRSTRSGWESSSD